MFNLDGDDGTDDGSNLTGKKVESEESEDDIDLESVEPSKVNWFKYIMDKHLKLKDEDGNMSALNTADAFVNLLNILLTSKKNEEI